MGNKQTALSKESTVIASFFGTIYNAVNSAASLVIEAGKAAITAIVATGIHYVAYTIPIIPMYAFWFIFGVALGVVTLSGAYASVMLGIACAYTFFVYMTAFFIVECVFYIMQHGYVSFVISAI